MSAEHFHAGLPPGNQKERAARASYGGDIRAIVATNAFGMGIDKPDVRLVIHADIPGSLENYLQEAGRAPAATSQAARCVLLYAQDDVERQFGMSARSRLTRQDRSTASLRALRQLDRKKRMGGEVVATTGEILREDDEHAFERDSATDDTRMRTAVAWLEEAVLLTREENRVQVFPSSLQVSSLDDARARLVRADVDGLLPRPAAHHLPGAVRSRRRRGHLHRRTDDVHRPHAGGGAGCPLRPGGPGHRQERHRAYRLRSR